MTAYRRLFAVGIPIVVVAAACAMDQHDRRNGR